MLDLSSTKSATLTIHCVNYRNSEKNMSVNAICKKSHLHDAFVLQLNTRCSTVVYMYMWNIPEREYIQILTLVLFVLIFIQLMGLSS